MDKKLANQIVQEALNIAIQKGCYDLIAVRNIVSALNLLANEEEMNSNLDVFVSEQKEK
jgi:hypothetical protein